MVVVVVVVVGGGSSGSSIVVVVSFKCVCLLQFHSVVLRKAETGAQKHGLNLKNDAGALAENKGTSKFKLAQCSLNLVNCSNFRITLCKMFVCVLCKKTRPAFEIYT